MQLSFGDYGLDINRRELTRGSELISVGPQVFDLLVYLVQHRDRVVSKQDLIDSIWRGRIVSESTLTSHINAVRKAVGDSGEEQRLIRTIPRKGVRFVGVVQEQSTSASEASSKEARKSSPALPHAQLEPVELGKFVAAKSKRLAGRRGLALAAPIVLILGIAALWMWRPWAPIAIGKPTLAVLPLTNLSGDPAEADLGRGIAEDLFTDIAKISGVLPAPWEESSRFSPSKIDLKEIGRRLNVTYVLTGDFRRLGGVLRVNVRLVNAPTGFNLWAEHYDRDAREIFAIQDDITKNVVAALKLKLTPTDQARVGKRTTSNPEAYELWLRAEAEELRPSPKGNASAIALLERAIALDPSFADAYAHLRLEYFWQWLFTGARDLSILEKGATLANRAITIAPSNLRGYAVLGFIQLYLRRHDQAIRALEYALKLDPNRGQSYADLAFAQLMAGNPAECLRLLQQAREHVSFEPWSFGLFAGQCYLFLNRYEDAVRELRSSIARNPRFGDTRRILAVVYFEMGDIEDARAEAGEALRLLHGDFISRIDRLIPFKNQKDRERELSALRRLGYSE